MTHDSTCTHRHFILLQLNKYSCGYLTHYCSNKHYSRLDSECNIHKSVDECMYATCMCAQSVQVDTL